MSLYPHPGGFRAHRVLDHSIRPVRTHRDARHLRGDEPARGSRGRDSRYSACCPRQPAFGLHIRRTDRHDQDRGHGERAGIFIAEPFLLVGLIAVVRSILLLTANLKGVQSMEEAQILLIELVVLIILVGVLTSTLYYARRMRLTERKREIFE
jgi:hypothetical protein